MAITTNGTGSDIVLQSGLGDEAAYGNAGNRTLRTGLTTATANDNTITIVSNASASTLTLYVDGVQAAVSNDWVAGSGETLALTGFQFGANFSNLDVITEAIVSNITVWNKALTSDEVKTLVVPEPSAFGLLAGIGALALVAARRRRAKA